MIFTMYQSLYLITGHRLYARLHIVAFVSQDLQPRVTEEPALLRRCDSTCTGAFHFFFSHIDDVSCGQSSSKQNSPALLSKFP